MRSLCGTLVVLFGTNAFAFKIVSFDGQFTRWDDNEVHYYLDSRGSKNFESDAKHGCDSAGKCRNIQDIARDSFETWTNVNGTNVNFVEEPMQEFKSTGNDGKNTISWVNKNWRGQYFSPPEEALAVTITTYKTSNNNIVDSDIHFNGEYFTWADINSTQEEMADVIDVQNILTHEIGHFVGLDHSSEDIFEPVAKLYLATMFFASGPGETFRRFVGEDDVNAISNLYPKQDAATPEITSISPEAIDVSQTRTATVRIRGRNFSNNATALLAIPGDWGDAVAQQLTIAPDEMTVVFNLSRVPNGKYDLVVANTFDRMDRVNTAISLTGAGDYGTETDSFSSSGGGGCQVKKNRNALAGILLLIFPVLLIGVSRVSYAFKHEKAAGNAGLGRKLRCRRPSR
jgi:hypothetical protein